MKLKSYLTEPAKTLNHANEVFLRRKGVEKGPLQITKWDVYRSSIFLELCGIDSVEKAESLIGFRILVSADHLETLPDDEYYWEELIGMTLMSEDGDVLGTLTSIFPTGSNDVYVCTGEKGEMLVPAIGDVVMHIDRAGRVMVIRLLAGMDKPC